jgi:histidine triad (HIT) family protein
MSADDCVFCTILAGELPASVIAETERAFAFADINPATRGHALVIPRTHVADVHEISGEDLTACALLAKDIAGRARDRLGADGVNLVHSAGAAAWQVVFSLPHPRHSTLCRRSAARAVAGRARRPDRDRRGRRRAA